LEEQVPDQTAITIRAFIRPGQSSELSELLADIDCKGAAHSCLPFADLPAVHFARLFVLPEVTDLDGEPIPASLVYMADVDGSLEAHLTALVEQAALGIDAVFAHCADYPGDPVPRPQRYRWLRTRVVTAATRYTHTVGRGAEQVRREAMLREAIENFLDRPGSVLAGATAVEAHRRIRAFVRGRPDLAWALRPARGSTLGFRVRNAAHLVAVPAAAAAAAPVLIPAAVAGAMRLRQLERRDSVDRAPIPPVHLATLEQHEDFSAQNPFTAVGLIRPELTRRLLLRGVLPALGWSMRHIYPGDNLAGVRTIHFARWLPIDGGRRLIFASNYDGSVESYMDDFIDRLAWGLNAVFSNGTGYPPTRWLFGEGARQEQAFKLFLRRHQLPTQVWFSAYSGLPARNVDQTARLRDGLTHPLTEQAAAAWLSLL
jgi:hypothetical protein